MEISDEKWEEFLKFYDGQFGWYDEKAVKNKWIYLTFRSIIVLIAAALPVLVTVELFVENPWVRGVLLTSTIVLLISEGFLYLTNCYENWQSYRTTAEALRRERQAFRVRVGPYAGVEDPRRTFATRVLSLISQEHRVWRILTDEDTPSQI